MSPRHLGPRTLNRDSSRSLWEQLHSDLIARLERGEFPERFPGEMELVSSYGVSRHTVREALRRLRQDGLIESSRGRSSVAHPGLIAQTMGAMYSLFHELESRGIDQHSTTRATELQVAPDAAVRLGVPEDTPLVYLERIRLGDDEPIAWDRAWLVPDLGAPLLEADLTHTALYDEWERTAGVRLTGGRESIRAVLPTEEQRGWLRMQDDEAALEVERVGQLGERAVEFRITLVRGNRFSFVAQWGQGRTYQVGITS